jgi:hypothetical protein
MKAKLLTELAQVHADVDYVDRFQALSGVNLEIRRQGPSSDRLLRKAILEMDIGNYGASLLAAMDAVALEPASAETHHQVGLAFLFLALARAGAVPAAPGHDMPREDASTLLASSLEAFRQSLKLNPDDQETREEVETIETVLLESPTELKLVRALRAHN